jgi:hypothetical protein
MCILVDIRGDKHVASTKSMCGGWEIPKPVSKVLVTSVKGQVNPRIKLAGVP